LEIVTNGTSIPGEDVITRMNRFKMNYVNVSLDTYSKANDYQRFGSSHEVTFNNAQAYWTVFKNVYVSFHTVISTLNSNELASSLDFLIDKHKYHVSVDFVREPEHQSMLYAPPSYIDWALDKNKGNFTAYRLLETFTKQASYDEGYWEEFLERLEKLDTYYGTRLEDYNPELAEYLVANKYCINRSG
jgi:sulfatase maturation enzyme AslB (radical SAM superfamily)